MTTVDVKGFGGQKGHREIYRGSEYDVDFLPKVLIIVAVADSLVETAVSAIIKAANTGAIGDGKVSFPPLTKQSAFEPPRYGFFGVRFVGLFVCERLLDQLPFRL
jgi:nitrogen regulatory protein PII